MMHLNSALLSRFHHGTSEVAGCHLMASMNSLLEHFLIHPNNVCDGVSHSIHFFFFK